MGCSKLVLPELAHRRSLRVGSTIAERQALAEQVVAAISRCYLPSCRKDRRLRREAAWEAAGQLQIDQRQLKKIGLHLPPVWLPQH